MYKKRFRAWGLDKKLKQDEVLVIFDQLLERNLQGKSSEILIRGRPVPIKRLESYFKRNEWALWRFFNRLPESHSTLRQISVRTPPPLLHEQLRRVSIGIKRVEPYRDRVDDLLRHVLEALEVARDYLQSTEFERLGLLPSFDDFDFAIPGEQSDANNNLERQAWEQNVLLWHAMRERTAWGHNRVLKFASLRFTVDASSFDEVALNRIASFIRIILTQLDHSSSVLRSLSTDWQADAVMEEKVRSWDVSIMIQEGLLFTHHVHVIIAQTIVSQDDDFLKCCKMEGEPDLVANLQLTQPVS